MHRNTNTSIEIKKGQDAMFKSTRHLWMDIDIEPGQLPQVLKSIEQNNKKRQQSHHRIQKQVVKYERNRQSLDKKRNQKKQQKRNTHRSFGKDRQHFQRRC